MRLTTHSTTVKDIAPTGVFTSCTCNDDQQHAALTVTNGAGVSSATCEAPDPTQTPKDPGFFMPAPNGQLNTPECAKSGKTFSPKDAKKTVEKFCKDFFVKRGDSAFGDPDSKTSAPGFVISLMVNERQGVCSKDVTKYDPVAIGADRCIANFMKSVDSCKYTDSTSALIVQS